MQMTKVPISIIFHVEAFAMANSEKNKIVSELNTVPPRSSMPDDTRKR